MRASLQPMRRVVAVLALALAFAPAAAAAPTATAPSYDSKGHLVQVPYAPPDLARLTKKKVSDIFLHVPKVVGWLKRYPKVVTYDASFDSTGLPSAIVVDHDGEEVEAPLSDTVTIGGDRPTRAA